MLDARKLTAAAAALIVAQTIVRAWLVLRGDFYGDDLILIGQASTHDILSWDFLGVSDDGHLMPAAYLLGGISTVIAPVQWWLPAVTLVVLQLIAALAVWRAIRIIAPDARGGALISFAFYLFVPMTVTSYVWWSTGLSTLPFQAALAYVVGTAVVLVRDRPTGARATRLTIGAAGAFAAGLLFFEKSFVIAPVAFVVAVLAARASSDGSPIAAAFGRARWLWAAMGALVVAWGGVFAATASFGDGHSMSQTVRLVWRTVNNGIVPSFTGGPWLWDRWAPSAPTGSTPIWMIVLGWLILVTLVVLTVRARRGVVAVWAFVAVYAVGVQFPTMWLRSGAFTSLELAQTLQHLPDTALVLALGFALIAAAPSSGGTHAVKVAPDRRLAVAAVAASAVFVLSSMVGTASFSQSWRDDPTGAYLANARQAMADNAGHVMFDQQLPIEVLLPVAYPDNQLSHVFGRLRDRPDFGVVTDRLVVLDSTGRAVPGGVTRARTIAESRGTCRAPGIGGPQVLRLDGPLFDIMWTVQLGYCANIDGQIELGLDGGEPVRVDVEAGLHVVYVRVDGGGRGLHIRPVTPGLRLHTGEGRVGLAVVAGLAP
ncbi:hypothetical protein nbrc107696_14930 [Gordonia spumicola]|uniref:Uncharacterized protein n=1 Tax=Gordonia spumicola TaxID=589161 RepID=A0A7I9V6X4_9ACTN|nr:hypothetical protein [Gordonia spumicola]GEE01047.1 hypothetical protein nbrc107696_14930 [Gordonia spumicola]